MNELIRADMADLLGRASFRRFLWRMIEASGLLDIGTNGADARDLNFVEGRRSLMLDMLADVEGGQVERHPSNRPLMALIQTLREEVQTPQQLMEKPRGRSRRIRPYRDIEEVEEEPE